MCLLLLYSQQGRPPYGADARDALPSGLRPLIPYRPFELGDALVEMPDLLYEHLHLEVPGCIEVCLEHLLKPLLAGKAFFFEEHPLAGKKVVDPVLERPPEL